MILSDKEILIAREKNYQLLAAKHAELIEELKEALSVMIDGFILDFTARFIGPYTMATYKTKYEKRVSSIEEAQIRKIIRAYAKELVQKKFTSEERANFDFDIVYFADNELRAKLEVITQPSTCIIL